ncbi:MAG: diguanylate cyclase domain-containing protein [Leptospirales bacterium]
MTSLHPTKPRPRWIRVQAILLFGILFVIFLILVFGTLTLKGSVSFFREMHDQERLVSVQHRLDAVLIDFLDTESGQRKFLLTRNTIFLGPYRDSRDRLVSALNRLVLSNFHPPVDPGTIHTLDTLVREKLRVMDWAIRLRGGDVGPRLPDTGPLNPQVPSKEKIRLIISQLDRVLQTESAGIRMKAERQESSLGVMALFFLSLLLVTLFLGYAYLWRHNRVMHGLHALLEKEAAHDPLTGLPNRRFLSETMEWMLARISRNPHVCAVLYLDLDGFKKVNDRFGHQAGDRLLIEFSRRLVANLRKGDLVARLGGDEFVVFLDPLESPDRIPEIVDGIVERLNESPLIPEIALNEVGVSIGWAVYPEDGKDVNGLIAVADRKMYERKAAIKKIPSIRFGGES